jgi:hypothetical protein
MRFGTWKVSSLYRAGLLKAVASELAKNSLHLVAVKEVRLDKGGSQPADDYMFFYVNGNANHHLQTGSFIHKGFISAVKKVGFFSDIMSYITLLTGRWCDIIVLNVHAPTEDKSDIKKGSFYEKLERVLDQFPKYHIKVLLGDYLLTYLLTYATLQDII